MTHAHTKTTAAGIERRRVDFDLGPHEVRRDWFGGDPYLSTYLDALSLLFPEGERFFVDSVKYFRDHIDDDELARDVVGFIGQEAMHGRAHRQFNRLLSAHGYEQAPELERHVRWLLQLVRRRLPKRWQLAATAALEHFTAIMAEMLLNSDELRDQIDERVRGLWAWHALEETEHKAVAFDVYRRAGGTYPERVGVMLLATVIFFVEVVHFHTRLLADRGILHKPWTWTRGLRQLWLWPGHFRRLIPAYLDYYRPSFHPLDRDSAALVAAWRETLFGEDGLLIAA